MVASRFNGWVMDVHTIFSHAVGMGLSGDFDAEGGAAA